MPRPVTPSSRVVRCSLPNVGSVGEGGSGRSAPSGLSPNAEWKVSSLRVPLALSAISLEVVEASSLVVLLLDGGLGRSLARVAGFRFCVCK